MKAYLFTAIAALAFSGSLTTIARADDSSSASSSRPSREVIHAAFAACAQETGVAAPTQGQRPSDEDRAKIDACMKAKGFNPPHGRPPGPPPDQSSQQSSDSQS